MANKDFDVLLELDDNQLKDLYDKLCLAWYVIHNNISQEYRVHDEDFMSFSEFCIKVTLEYSKRFLECD